MPTYSHSDPDEPTGDLVPTSGSAPTDAHLATNALLARVLLEVARRRGDELPGLTETLQDQVLITCGGTASRVYGWFDAEAWQHGDRPVHELFVNACFSDRPPDISPTENVMTTLLHEACHVYAAAEGIKDTSRQERYHNRRFAQLAVQIGLVVVPDQRIGHHTPRLSARGQADYADLLVELGQGLVIQRTPPPLQPREPAGTPGNSLSQPSPETAPPATASKYVFAACSCQVGRGPVTIRVARGGWRPGVIRCGVCQRSFDESRSTT
ncbi:hypothetical protein [Amycolatopsis samaneae]|uniref:SprT-like family protein n=1 Tax=Amycolatopsis samaneae TaxID=664691 RepID=A0ABW5GU13_9PSEU